MANSIDKASQNIATNLVGVRRTKGISQSQLAELSGLTRASIALIESGSSNPSLESLIKLSQCLRISIDELIASPRAECKLMRAKDIPIERRSRPGVELRKLLPDPIPATEIDELILQPDAILTGTPHVQGTREYFTCIKGEVNIGVLGDVHQLKKGDVLSFPGDKPHSYKNVGKSVAQGISVVLFASEFAP